MTTSSSTTVSGVLQSTQRRAVCTKRLSNEQLIIHGRGAQTLRNTSLFDATIPFGFTSISSGSSSADAPTPSTSSSIPSTSHAASPPPFAPLMIQSNGKDGEGGGSFVFARRSDTPPTQAVVSSPPAAILSVFLPLSIPPHLSPRSTPPPETTWTDTSPCRPNLSRSLTSESWTGAKYLEDIPSEDEDEKHEDPAPMPKHRQPPSKRPKMRRAITNDNFASLSTFFS